MQFKVLFFSRVFSSFKWYWFASWQFVRGLIFLCSLLERRSCPRSTRSTATNWRTRRRNSRRSWTSRRNRSGCSRTRATWTRPRTSYRNWRRSRGSWKCSRRRSGVIARNDGKNYSFIVSFDELVWVSLRWIGLQSLYSAWMEIRLVKNAACLHHLTFCYIQFWKILWKKKSLHWIKLS